MAGTIFGLGLMSQFDASGDLARGALLYVYDANTSTPVTIYSDFALSSTHSWPVEADSAGRLPQFWLADGSYRVRLTTSAGVEIFDEQSITALGASDGGSGSGSAAQDTSTLFQTGDMLWIPIAGTRSGWVRSNGRTIGSGASGGTERANSDTQSLFEYLWNNFSDSLCAVSSGRGANAAADFNANKTIATLDMRSRAAFGLGNMGNTSSGVTGASTTPAAAIGASTYTIAQANLPSVTFTVTDDRKYEVSMRSTSATETAGTGGGTAADNVNQTSTISMASPTSGSISANSGGSGTNLEILTPMRVGTWFIKL
jgi:hypothetical protein